MSFGRERETRIASAHAELPRFGARHSDPAGLHGTDRGIARRRRQTDIDAAANLATSSGRRDMGYHHGDLRAALIRTSFELLAECGLSKFSVAAVARRLGVSSAAPYRHFPDRDHLLSAVSAAAARDLRSAILAAADAAGPDPCSRLASLAGAYFRYVVRTGAGLHVIYAAELYEVPDDARREHTRALMETILDL